MSTEINFHQRLLEIAQADDAVTNELPRLQEIRDALYEQHVKALDLKIEQIKSASSVLRAALRDDVMAYVEETGDVTPHERITVRRKMKWMYDKDEALTWARTNRPDFVRIKESLDVRPFEKALSDGMDFNAEQVPAPEIVIPSKLGDLLIIAENAGEGTSE